MSKTPEELAIQGHSLVEAARAEMAGHTQMKQQMKPVAGTGVHPMEPSTPPSSGQGAVLGVQEPQQTSMKSAFEEKAVSEPQRTKPVAQQEEEREFHQPYSRDVRPGQQVFPGFRGHETEEYEEVEAYASPDDANPELRRKVESMERSGDWGKTPGAKQELSFMGKEERKEGGIGSDVPAGEGEGEGVGVDTQRVQREAGETVEGLKESTVGAASDARGKVESVSKGLMSKVEELVGPQVEAGRRAARVTVERVAQAVQAAKEAVGLPKDQPLGAAAKEKASNVAEVTRDKASQAAQAVADIASRSTERARRVTVEAIQSAKEAAAQVPSSLAGAFDHGKRLAEEKDRAVAEQKEKEAEERERSMVRTGGKAGALVPPAASLAKDATPASSTSSTDVHSKHKEHQEDIGVSKSLPVPVEKWDQEGVGGKEKGGVDAATGEPIQGRAEA